MIVYQDLLKKKESDLEKLLSEKRHEVHELQFKARADELKNVRSIRKLKREIAKILTALTERGK